MTRARLVIASGDVLEIVFDDQRDRHTDDREAVEEVGRAVERVDDPAVAAVALGLAAFLAQEGVRRVGVA